MYIPVTYLFTFIFFNLFWSECPLHNCLSLRILKPTYTSEYILKYFSFLFFSPLKRFMLTIWIMSKLPIPKWHFAWKRLKGPTFSWHLPRNLWEFGLMLFLLEPKVIKNFNNYDLMFFIAKVIRNIYYPQTKKMHKS